MSEVELPPPEYWRCPRFGNDGVLFRSRLQAVANGEQVCEALYTADQMRAYGRQCYEAALEAAAVVAMGHKLSPGAESCDVRDELAAAIRAMKHSRAV